MWWYGECDGGMGIGGSRLLVCGSRGVAGGVSTWSRSLHHSKI